MLWAIKYIALIKAGYINKLNQSLQKMSSYPLINIQNPMTVNLVLIQKENIQPRELIKLCFS